jgi:hypothetical protein
MQSASPMARHLNTPSPADTLDHSFATTANMLGCSEPTIAALLGHSRGSVTGRYVHVVDETLLAAADRVSGAIDQAMAGEKPASSKMCAGLPQAHRDVLESARLGLAAERRDRLQPIDTLDAL